jgi:hypothetical protein
VSTRAQRQDGQVSVEFAALLPWMILFVLFGWQLLFTSMAINAVENAARVGSRAASLGLDGHDRAEQALPDWLRESSEVEVGPNPGCRDDARPRGTRVVVCARVPLLFPGVPWEPVGIRRAAEFPVT